MSWTSVCELSDIGRGTGVCALVRGLQIAIFNVSGRVYAVGNRDPFSGAGVLSRGIVGDREGEPKVASPLYKQSFSLVTGACLDDPEVSIPVYGARIRAGVVEVAA